MFQTVLASATICATGNRDALLGVPWAKELSGALRTGTGITLGFGASI